MNAIKWISAEAKKIKRAHPKKYKKWTQYIREASNKYAREKKPAGRKKAAPRRRRLGVSTVPAGLPLYSPRKKVMAGARKKRLGAIKRTFKSNQRPGEYPPPIAWHIVKQDSKGFIKKGDQYFTLSSFPRRIVWQDWEAKTAKAYLKKHCLKSK